MSNLNEESSNDLKETKSNNTSPEMLTQSAVKDFLMSRGGQVKYSELFEQFRNSISDSTNDDLFQEYISNIATKRTEIKFDSTPEEWIILKKKHRDHSTRDETLSTNDNFFAHTLNRTKKNFSKFSHAFHQNSSSRNEKEQNKISGSGSAHNIAQSSEVNLTQESICMGNATGTSSSFSHLPDILGFTQKLNNSYKPAKKTNSLLFLENTEPNKRLSTSSLTNPLFNYNNVNEIPDESNIYENESTNATADESQSKLSQSQENNNDDNIRYSVKEQAKKLNRLNTETELRNFGEILSQKSSMETAKAQIDKVELESFNFSDPNPIEKEWILVCSRGNYMEMAKILSKNSYLAQKRDPFNGYTCAHWACKHGNVEVLKLIASTLENDTKTNPKSIRINNLINSKTRAGYTCSHICYLYGHSELVPYLRTYGAESLTDYSGKLGMDYSKTSAANEMHHLSLIDIKYLKARDLLHDPSLIMKRSSSSVIGKEKERESKNELKFNSMRNEIRTAPTRPKILNFSLNESSPLSQNNGPHAAVTAATKSNQSSPLNLIDAFSHINIGSRHTVKRTHLKNQNKTGCEEESQHNTNSSHHLTESKENIPFI